MRIKIEMDERDIQEISNKVTKKIYEYMQENMTIRAIISQEIKKYFDEEKKSIAGEMK